MPSDVGLCVDAGPDDGGSEGVLAPLLGAAAELLASDKTARVDKRLGVLVMLSIRDVAEGTTVLETASSVLGAEVAAGAWLCIGVGGSASSSDSDSSPSEATPTVDALLNGESGLSGPSSTSICSSSSTSTSVAPGAGAVLAADA